jgi:hypothetical protein
MRLVALLILIVGVVVGVSLIRAGGGGGTGMFLFAILAVIFFSALPVLTGKFGARHESHRDGLPDREVIDLKPTESESGR